MPNVTTRTLHFAPPRPRGGHPILPSFSPSSPTTPWSPLLGQEGKQRVAPKATGWFEARLPPPRPLRGHPSSGRRGKIFFSPPFQGGVARSAGVVTAAP